MKAYAHSDPEGRGQEAWHVLEEHLTSTAKRAAAFTTWAAQDLSYLAGLWHDLGKYAPDWQGYLREVGIEAPALGEESVDDGSEAKKKRRGPDHSTAGAIHAQLHLGNRPELRFPVEVLAFVIAGHHAGLADRDALKGRLKRPEKEARYELVRSQANEAVLSPGILPTLPPFLQRNAEQVPKDDLMRSLEAFVRMTFSALVDADFLDTEAFMSGSGRDTRLVERHAWPSLAAYRPVLDEFLRGFEGQASSGVNEARCRVLRWCQEAASGSRGAYTLTVPTGGGKTLSSLAFALRHAEANDQKRVIVALPFLSILDQTADVYRQALAALGEGVLLEHHSNISAPRDTVRNRLAAENWDAPLIVTTQVQLFESLFSNRPSHCRKLHNIADSVVVLDEVQSLPVELLAPMLGQLRTLVSSYGVSLLLTTATQPGLHSRMLGPKLFQGLDPKPTEIVPEASMNDLFEGFRRVRVEWPASAEAVGWEDLAMEIVAHDQVLAIVHQRRDARELWSTCERLLPGQTIHLSALMCPAHRRAVLARIKGLLGNGKPCRVVSTQLVEAGVDVDFPLVYRAMGGLESLAQSAGRCNREGRLTRPGRFVVFHPPSDPPGVLRQHRDEASLMLRADSALDILLPSTFRKYFDRLYSRRSLDTRDIQTKRSELKFAEVAAAFRMMDDGGESVFVPYGKEGKQAIEALRFGGPSRDTFRALQPFGVSVFPEALVKLGGAVGLVHESAWVLMSDRQYDERLGLLEEDPGGLLVA